MWSKLLRIKLIIVIFLVSFACKKEKYPKMKTGYYAVTDIRTFLNDSIDTLFYKALGPIGMNEDNTRLSFYSNISNQIFNNSFDFYNLSSLNSGGSDYINYKINYYEISENELNVNRTEKVSLYTSIITFKYIE